MMPSLMGAIVLCKSVVFREATVFLAVLAHSTYKSFCYVGVVVRRSFCLSFQSSLYLAGRRSLASF